VVFVTGGGQHVPLYESMIEEVIVWSGFASTSTDEVIDHFLENENSILLTDYSEFDEVDCNINGIEN
jgi:6-phosphogluconolactonase/glucosamine-6-phosphate isomerase/deaminase